MKKLSLKSLELEASDMLGRHQLMTVFGGYVPSGSCAWQGGGIYSGVSGTSRDYAEDASNTHGGHWCCDSCCDVGWLSSSHKGYLGCEGYSEY
ncbi:hypothetical protein [Algibacter sp. 2305UL17-15]|uniref:hypothetical protein n=1 Tax=Algibacter sp. 2305UL17-15 TaxID=3231268 RepID=UPI00345ADEFC